MVEDEVAQRSVSPRRELQPVAITVNESQDESEHDHEDNDVADMPATWADVNEDEDRDFFTIRAASSEDQGANQTVNHGN